MTTILDTVDTAASTSIDTPNPPRQRQQGQIHQAVLETPPKSPSVKYNHVFAIHKQSKISPLDHEAEKTPSFFGFKNLMAIMLIVSNLRLMIENIRKYGVLICLSCHELSRSDLYIGSILYFSVPCHLLVAYIIELVAARWAEATVTELRKQESGQGVTKKATETSQQSFRHAWYIIAIAHALNATLNLAISSYFVYTDISHPAIGFAVELHAVIVWLKVCSYAFTNRDLRQALLRPELSLALPEIYASCPYPENVTLKNLCYFWAAPTLIYQPVYPRSPRIRRTFLMKRIGEVIGLSIMIWFVTMQYASPLLHNALDGLRERNYISIVERVLKLSTVSLFLWLCGFYALFHSFLNAVAEITRFADREFYTEWWNVPDVRTYWTTWNKPVYHFMKRHIYSPLVGRGFSSRNAQLLTFVFSGFLHELLIGIPTHNFKGIAFIAMLSQVPFILATDGFKKRADRYGWQVVGNSVFWVVFCIFGQPFAAMIYFYLWQCQYGRLKP